MSNNNYPPGYEQQYNDYPPQSQSNPYTQPHTMTLMPPSQGNPQYNQSQQMPPQYNTQQQYNAQSASVVRSGKKPWRDANGEIHCKKCGQIYPLSAGMTSWRCKQCTEFNSTQNNQCIIQ